MNFPTHNKNHVLDLVITFADSSLAPSLSSTHCSPSDHFLVFAKLSINSTPLTPPTLHSFRLLQSIDSRLVKSSEFITDPPKSFDFLLIVYNTTLSSLLDKYSQNSRSASLHPTPGLLLLFVLFDLLCLPIRIYHWIGAVSYTHLTLPTNREV